jgi:hypothetical protein
MQGRVSRFTLSEKGLRRQAHCTLATYTTEPQSIRRNHSSSRCVDLAGPAFLLFRAIFSACAGVLRLLCAIPLACVLLLLHAGRPIGKSA